MSCKEEIGIISSDKIITWMIKDFFTYTKEDIGYCSSEFHVLNSAFQLKIWPKGKTSDASTGYISIFLYRVDNGPPKLVEFELGIKTANYLSENTIKTSWKANKLGWGFSKFIGRISLEREKDILVPSGTLTIVCTLKDVHEDFSIDTSKVKLVADVKSMFISQKNTDVTLKVNEETFSAHRFILAARSPTLAAMFEKEMTEKKTEFVDVSDCDPGTFKHFLYYLYAGELDTEGCDFFLLYKIADKYDVPELKQICTEYIIDRLCHHIFFEAYIFACEFNEIKLLPNVQNYFNKNFEQIFALDNWEYLMKNNTSLANKLLKAMAPTVEAKQYLQ